jgi:hypothetical protein
LLFVLQEVESFRPLQTHNSRIMAPASPWVQLLGPTLLKNVGNEVRTEDALRHKEVIMLYFSGKVSPCVCVCGFTFGFLLNNRCGCHL